LDRIKSKVFLWISLGFGDQECLPIHPIVKWSSYVQPSELRSAGQANGGRPRRKVLEIREHEDLILETARRLVKKAVNDSMRTHHIDRRTARDGIKETVDRSTGPLNQSEKREVDMDVPA